jgi:predicted GIY-YIG superfamily endonuclease
MPSQREHWYTVYILGSSSGTLYVGIASDLRTRLRLLRHRKQCDVTLVARSLRAG